MIRGEKEAGDVEFTNPEELKLATPFAGLRASEYGLLLLRRKLLPLEVLAV